jgi:hypothetical protein
VHIWAPIVPAITEKIVIPKIKKKAKPAIKYNNILVLIFILVILNSKKLMIQENRKPCTS